MLEITRWWPAACRMAVIAAGLAVGPEALASCQVPEAVAEA